MKFDENLNHVAHKTLPFGTVVEFTNIKNNKKITGVVVDRGPYIKGRTFDLSKSMAIHLGFYKQGVSPIKYKIVKYGKRK